MGGIGKGIAGNLPCRISKSHPCILASGKGVLLNPTTFLSQKLQAVKMTVSWLLFPIFFEGVVSWSDFISILMEDMFLSWYFLLQPSDNNTNFPAEVNKSRFALWKVKKKSFWKSDWVLSNWLWSSKLLLYPAMLLDVWICMRLIRSCSSRPENGSERRLGQHQILSIDCYRRFEVLSSRGKIGTAGMNFLEL